MESGPKQSGSCSLSGLLEVIVFSNVTEKAEVWGHLYIGPWTWIPFQASVFLLHRLILKTFLWSPEVQGLLLQLPLVPTAAIFQHVPRNQRLGQGGTSTCNACRK